MENDQRRRRNSSNLAGVDPKYDQKQLGSLVAGYAAAAGLLRAVHSAIGQHVRLEQSFRTREEGLVAVPLILMQ